MLELGVLGGVMLLVVMGTLASVGWDLYEMRNRENWWWAALLLIECVLMPNPYLAAVLAMFTLGLWQIGKSWYILRGVTIPTVALAACYIAVVPHLGRWMIAPLLWSVVAVGCGLGLWAVAGMYKPERPWTWTPPPRWHWWGTWGIYEHMTGPGHHICGQGNTLHLTSLASVTVAAACGLAWLGQWWALLAVPLCGLPAALVWWYSWAGRWHINQGVMNLGVLGLGGLWLVAPLSAAVLGIGAVVGVGLWLGLARPWTCRHRGGDSGRLDYWWNAIRLVWWPAGWRRRLFGFGTSTWFLATFRMCHEYDHLEVFSAAHNEYVQQLVERGIIGLAVLVAYLADALWRTSHGGPEGAAVFLVGLMVCSVALVNFPWTFHHEYHPAMVDGKPNHDEQWFGSPPLNVVSFVVALLAETIR